MREEFLPPLAVYIETVPTGNGYCAYRAVVVKRGDVVAATWASGDPIKDWDRFLSWVGVGGRHVMESSSITHFFQDVPGYRMIEDRHGMERMVLDPKDTIEAREAFDRERGWT